MRLTAGCFGKLNMTGGVGHPHPKRKPIRSVLINGMCNFKDGTRAATAATVSSVGLDVKYKRLRHVVAEPAHKAKWHNKRNGASYVSTVRNEVTE